MASSEQKLTDLNFTHLKEAMVVEVEWCECSSAFEEGRVANERAWVVVVE